MGGFFIILVIIVVIVGLILSHQAALRRRDEMRQVATSLGLGFQESNDYSLDDRYHFINKLCQGDDRYGFNIMSGRYQGHPVQAFDYHYETESTDSDGDRTTHHHYFSFFILNFPGQCPELLISREGWTSKIAQFLGFDDIDFESAEFSRQFVVKSPDKKFAYDICHGQVIEFLLNHRDLNIEIERDCLTFFFDRRLKPEQIRHNLDRIVAFRELFPKYLFA